MLLREILVNRRHWSGIGLPREWVVSLVVPLIVIVKLARYSPKSRILESFLTFQSMCVKEPTRTQEIIEAVVAFSALSASAQGGYYHLPVPVERRITLKYLLSEECSVIVSCGADCTIKVRDVETWEVFKLLEGHTDWVNGVALSPDGKRIVSWSNDATIRVWDVETGRELKKMEGHTRAIIDVALTPDGNSIVSSSVDRTIRVWDVQTGTELKKLEGHTDWVNGVALSPDGRNIVSWSNDGMRHNAGLQHLIYN